MESESKAVLVQRRPIWPVLAKRARALGHFMRSKPLGAVGLVLVFFFAFVALAAPAIAPYDPMEVRSFRILEAPNKEFWFGTDIFGRDILSRTIYGSRISIYVGLITMVLSSVMGALLGVASAYLGGRFDLIVQRFVDATAGFPPLLLALALVAAFGPSLNNVIVALIIVFTPRITRVVRSVALSIKSMPYVDAAIAIGAVDVRIMLRHILPNTFAPLIVVSTSLIGSAILIEASLSFLGVGMPANVITWGKMVSGPVLTYFASAPWIAVFPGLALTLAVFGINVFGDSLRDVLDPKLRGR